MSTKIPIPPSGMGDDSLRNYLVEEFVEDYQDGRITRREALVKLASIFGSMAIATSFLAACAPAPTATPVPPTATTVKPTTALTSAPSSSSSASSAAASSAGAPSPLSVAENDPAIEAKMVDFKSGADTVNAYMAKPKGDGPFPIVLVCHENRGLTDHIKDVTRRVAKAGYAALGVDLLSREGGTDKVAANAPGVLGNVPPQRFVDDFRAGVTYMQSQSFVRKDRVGMVGFCFGGGVTWRCVEDIADLKAAVPYYGPNPPLENVGKIQAAVLAHYGALDSRIDAGIPDIENAMKQNGKTFEKNIYPNANHAFNNDTGASYNADAAKEAWAKTLAWFEKYLKS